MEKAHNTIYDQINLSAPVQINFPQPLPSSNQFLQMLEMNVESFTYYLEELILDNPFVEMDFHLEQFVPSLNKDKNHQHPQEDLIEEDQTSSNEGEAIEDEKDFGQSLESYLFEQIMLYRKTPIRDVMTQLVELLDDRGYLPYSLEDLVEKLHEDAMTVLDGLTLFKLLEPAGVGAYDFKESLMLQTERDNYAPNIAYYLLEEFFDSLVKQDYQKIHAETNFSEAEIMEAVNYYHTLQKFPAQLFDKEATVHVVPDLKLEVPNKNNILIKYHRQYSPRLYFNEKYYQEMLEIGDDQLNDYIAEQVKKYNQVAKEVRTREEMLMSLAQVMAKRQEDFFLNKTSIQNELTLGQISQAMGIPESYVARLIKNKSMEFKNQVIPLTDFINQSYSPGRDGLSANNIKDKIKSVILHSDERLTDEAIAKLLEAQGIVVSDYVIGTYRKTFTK